MTESSTENKWDTLCRIIQNNAVEIAGLNKMMDIVVEGMDDLTSSVGALERDVDRLKPGKR